MNTSREAYRDRTDSLHYHIAQAVASYMERPADLIKLRWFRRAWGFNAQSFGPLTGPIADALHERVHVAVLTRAEADQNPLWDDPANIKNVDMDALWADAVATVTESDVRRDLTARLDYLAPEGGDPDRDPHVKRMREILGLIHSWRTGGPVPPRWIIGWGEAAEVTGLKPSDLRARSARGMFPERQGEARAAYGQVSPCWWADTLDTWWESLPSRGPRRQALAAD